MKMGRITDKIIENKVFLQSQNDDGCPFVLVLDFQFTLLQYMSIHITHLKRTFDTRTVDVIHLTTLYYPYA